MKHIHILTYISYGRLLDPTIPLTHLHFVNFLCYQIGHSTFYSSWKSLNFKVSQIQSCSLNISTIFVLKVFSHFSSLWFLRVLFHVVTSSHFYWTPQKPQNPQNPQKTWHTTRSPTSLAGRRSPTDAGLESSTHTGGGRRTDLRLAPQDKAAEYEEDSPAGTRENGEFDGKDTMKPQNLVHVIAQ